MHVQTNQIKRTMSMFSSRGLNPPTLASNTDIASLEPKSYYRFVS